MKKVYELISGFHQLNHKQLTVIFFLLLTLTNCTVIGSKDAFFVSKNSSWKNVENLSKDSYRFECEGLRIDIDEVIISATTYSFGPLIPFIPSGKHHDKQNHNLALKIHFSGKVDAIDFEKNLFSVKLFSADEALQIASSDFIRSIENSLPDSQQTWFQYVLMVQYQEKQGDFNQLSLELFWPFNNCEPPALHLERKEVSDNEFILTPGV